MNQRNRASNKILLFFSLNRSIEKANYFGFCFKLDFFIKIWNSHFRESLGWEINWPYSHRRSYSWSFQSKIYQHRESICIREEQNKKKTKCNLSEVIIRLLIIFSELEYARAYKKSQLFINIKYFGIWFVICTHYKRKG